MRTAFITVHHFLSTSLSVKTQTTTKITTLNMNSLVQFALKSTHQHSKGATEPPTASLILAALFSILKCAYLKFCRCFSCFPIQRHQKRSRIHLKLYVSACACDLNNLDGKTSLGCGPDSVYCIYHTILFCRAVTITATTVSPPSFSHIKNKRLKRKQKLLHK